ncbi:hypothetical protein, partial [Kitasatospora sp. P5_F3]
MAAASAVPATMVLRWDRGAIELEWVGEEGSTFRLRRLTRDFRIHDWRHSRISSDLDARGG